jgi:uncharacterized iron-regulated membrane protein
MNQSKLENRRLARFRRWHKWAGIIAGLFLLVMGATGIILNYKQPIFAKLGIESKRGDRDASPLPTSHPTNEVALTTGGITGGTVNFAGALALARAEWGDASLERIEIRSSDETVTYRFRNEDGAEFWVDAADGRHLVKGEYERIGKPDKDGKVARSTDWGKILIDLHTGRIGGGFGKALISCVAALLLFLSLSGFYLWLKPLFVRLGAKRR